MSTDSEPLYDQSMSAALREREQWWDKERKKFGLLLENLGPCRRLVDIGCGWGQLLQLVSDRVEEVWGVDESSDRLADTVKTCPKAKTVQCRADRLELPDAHFDAAVTSQMLHEVKLFGRPEELGRTVREIHRVLVSGGLYFLLDHAVAESGEVVVRLTDEKMRQLAEFEAKYSYYAAGHEILSDGTVRIAKRCLQDFLTKIWALGTPMESMEMNETHNVFAREEVEGLLASAGFAIDRWIAFCDIREDLKFAGGELLSGEPWRRKFLAIAKKT